MAGAYPDNPSRRMAWDADGSQVAQMSWQYLGHSYSDTVSVLPIFPNVEVSLTIREELNGEFAGYSDGIGAYYQTYTTVIFPEDRDVDGLHYNRHGGHAAWTDWSGDTTNGRDGTWTDLSYNGEYRILTPLAIYRTAINPFSVSDAKAVRFYDRGAGTIQGGPLSIHIYGSIAAGETPDRLLFLDTAASDAEFVKPIDQGDVYRGQEIIRTFKLKNNSSTKQINTVQVTALDLSYGIADDYTFSEDGVSYQATLNTIGNMAAGATQLVYMKLNVDEDRRLGPQVCRIKANHASLT